MKRPVQLQSLFRNISQDYEIFPRLEIKGPESADDVTAGMDWCSTAARCYGSWTTVKHP